MNILTLVLVCALLVQSISVSAQTNFDRTRDYTRDTLPPCTKWWKLAISPYLLLPDTATIAEQTAAKQKLQEHLRLANVFFAKGCAYVEVPILDEINIVFLPRYGAGYTYNSKGNVEVWNDLIMRRYLEVNTFKETVEERSRRTGTVIMILPQEMDVTLDGENYAGKATRHQKNAPSSTPSTIGSSGYSITVPFDDFGSESHVKHELAHTVLFRATELRNAPDYDHHTVDKHGVSLVNRVWQLFAWALYATFPTLAQREEFDTVGMNDPFATSEPPDPWNYLDGQYISDTGEYVGLCSYSPEKSFIDVCKDDCPSGTYCYDRTCTCVKSEGSTSGTGGGTTGGTGGSGTGGSGCAKDAAGTCGGSCPNAGEVCGDNGSGGCACAPKAVINCAIGTVGFDPTSQTCNSVTCPAPTTCNLATCACEEKVGT